MSTVTAKPAYGSVEGLAEIIRQRATTTDHVYSLLAGILDALVGDRYATDADKVAHVRNALAAAELVSGEIQAARR